MTQKSFLEILSEKIEKQILKDVSQSQNSPTQQSINQTENEKSTRNVDKLAFGQQDSSLKKAAYYQWINQIPLGEIHFLPPRQQVFGRIYPLNQPRPPSESTPTPRKKHVLNELQKQSLVYFWGFQIHLKEDFTSVQLKKAFRSLAHKLHPDRNHGKTKAFIELKAHYNCLLSVF